MSLQEYYLRVLDVLESYKEVLDVAKQELTHVEPWMSGNARGASTAFCILYKLFTMRLSVQQLIRMIDAGETPYIRALGFLYLRYGAEAKTLWWWFAKYLRDEQVFAPSAADPTAKVSMGTFCRDLLLDQYYFETIFPRIPETVRRAFQATLAKLGYNPEPAGCGGLGGSRRQIDDGTIAKRPQSVKAALSVNLAQRAPHLPSNREHGRGLDSTYTGSKAASTPAAGAASANGTNQHSNTKSASDRLHETSDTRYRHKRSRSRDRRRRQDGDSSEEHLSESRSRRKRTRSRSRDRKRHRSHERKRSRSR